MQLTAGGHRGQSGHRALCRVAEPNTIGRGSAPVLSTAERTVAAFRSRRDGATSGSVLVSHF